MIAAVGTDGVRLVVWGLGESEEEAREDAARWLAETPDTAPTLEMHEITAWEASIVLAGDVAWPIADVSHRGG